MGFFDGAGSGLFSAGGNILGGAISAWSSHNAAKQEYARQKEFAQNGIRWKVADAKAAGIHPIFAIGANTTTYSPQAAVGNDFGLSAAGQSIGRAIEAKQTREERDNAQQIQNEIGQAQADYYRAQADLARTKADLAGQKAVEDALQDIRKDQVGSMAAASQSVIRKQQQQPPIPSQSNIVDQIGALRNPKGQIVSLANTQNYHDLNEDVAIVEAIPFLAGVTWDFRAKITREPILIDGKWHAYNGEEYLPININTYKPRWKKWFETVGADKINHDFKSSKGHGGIRGFYGS